MKFETLNDLFLLKVMAMYDVEQVLAKALPKMIRAATNPDLRQAFKDHLEETEGHARRLEKVFILLHEKPKKTKVEAVRGLVEDGRWIMDQKMTDEALDAALIGAARHVEYYEMSGYSTLVDWAKLVGNAEIEELLQDTLKEEENADVELCEIGRIISMDVGLVA